MPPSVVFTLYIYFIFTPTTKLASNSSFGRIIHCTLPVNQDFPLYTLAQRLQLVRITLKGRNHKMAEKQMFFLHFQRVTKIPID
jgi:hypothetical protein